MPQALERIVTWQKAIKLATEVRVVVRGFPDSERYELCPQIRRAATSIAANVAEGYGRIGTRDYARFLAIARGSAYELFSHLTIARNDGYAVPDPVFAQLEEVTRLINASIGALGKLVREETADYGADGMATVDDEGPMEES